MWSLFDNFTRGHCIYRFLLLLRCHTRKLATHVSPLPNVYDVQFLLLLPWFGKETDKTYLKFGAREQRERWNVATQALSKSL